MIQFNVNNAFNAVTSLTSNKLIYELKIKNRFTTISKKIDDKLVINKKFKKSLNAIRLRMRQKIFDAVFFVNVKTKMLHDKRHKLLLLKKQRLFKTS